MEPIEPPADHVIWPVLVSLAECLCQQITDSGLPEPCFCGILPGGPEVAFDYCDSCEDGTCGQAWVRLGNVFPSTVFPAPQVDNAKCTSPLAFEVEVGIVRCAPAMGDEGQPPSLGDQFVTAQLAVADMMAMRRAILCCANSTKGRDYYLGAYSPIGPEGGCVGGSWATAFSEM